MIAILCNGIWLDIPSDATIRIDEEMPHFASSVFQGDVLFPFDLPWTPRNVKALGALWLQDVVDKQLQQTVQVYIKGIDFGTAQLHAIKCSDRIVSVNLVMGLAGLSIISKKLPEFAYSGTVTIGTDTDTVIAHAVATNALSYPQTDYQFPTIRNNDFYGNVNPDFGGYINNWETLFATFTKNTGYGQPERNTNVLVPQPYLLKILQYCFKEAGYEIAGDFVDDENVQRMLLYSNFGLDKRLPWVDVSAEASGAHSHSHPLAITWFPLTFDVETSDAYGWYDDSTSTYESEFGGRHVVTIELEVNVTSVTPAALNVRVLRNGTQEDIYTAPSVVIGLNTVTATLEFTSTIYQAMDDMTFEIQVQDPFGQAFTVNTAALLITNTSPSIINCFATELNLQNHVPDITLGELLSRLRGAPFFLDMSLDRVGHKVYFNYTQNTLTSAPTTDLTGKIAPGSSIEFLDQTTGYTVKMGWPSGDAAAQLEFGTPPSTEYLGEYDCIDDLPFAYLNLGKTAFVRNLNSIYECTQASSGLISWGFKAYAYADVVVGDGSNELVAEITPLLMVDHTLGILPFVLQKGQSDVFSMGRSSFTDTRIFYWQGMTPGGSSGDDYPFATSLDRDDDGTVNGTMPLRNEGADGLYETKQSNWLNALMNGELLRGIANLDIVDLLKFNTGRIRVKFQTYFLRKRSTIWGKQVSSTEVELLKL
jgi:hypothetical protein